MASIAILGGGFSGSLLALKLRAAAPDLDIVLVERGAEIGKGVAYGCCDSRHLLNVPVHRMELGLDVSFIDWLRADQARLASSLGQSGGVLEDAFVPRALFGAYLHEKMNEAVSASGGRLAIVRGEAVEVEAGRLVTVRLRDGRTLQVDRVVLALGHLPPRLPTSFESPVYASPRYVADPWEKGALNGIGPDEPVVMIGSGLTMVDVALHLARQGHKGSLTALSRRGHLPQVHRGGGAWPALVLPADRSPRNLIRFLRAEAARAEAAGVPWQRVADAARPVAASLWQGWTAIERALFLRHLRPWWDLHRHRMAPEAAEALAAMESSGHLRVLGGRIEALEAGPAGIELRYRPRGQKAPASLQAAHIVNCTGPNMSIGRTGEPIILSLIRQNLLKEDPLGLGLETDDCAVIDGYGWPSKWLFALGPLTRPSLWEVTAVPEIRVQVERLALRLAGTAQAASLVPRPRHALASAFADLGAGI